MKTTEEMAIDEIEVQKIITANKARPKKEEVRDSNNKLIQTTEISDDGRIVVVKTNSHGL